MKGCNFLSLNFFHDLSNKGNVTFKKNESKSFGTPNDTISSDTDKFTGSSVAVRVFGRTIDLSKRGK